jgi:hypothetical protein
MTHRYVFWASATVVVAGAALLACGGDETTMNPDVVSGSGGTVSTAGTTTGGSAGMVTTPTSGTGAAGKPAASGTGGTTPAAGGSGANSGGAGSTAPTAGTMAASGGTMAATGGTMAAAGGSGATGAAGGGATPAAGSCGPETMLAPADLGDPMKKGPWATAMKASSGPMGGSTLFYPMDLGKDGVLHPVFHWGCGAGSQPSQYADHLTLLASHGIVVIANPSGSMPAKASLDWMLAENDKMGSMFYKKLDPNRVGTGGHSLGALETFQAADDPRLKLYILVCGGSGSGTTGAANIHGPSIFLGGEGEGGTTNFQADYMAITKAPSVFVTKTDTDHIYCARNNLAPWVAFMRWNFCGEDKWKKEFMPGGTYCKAPWLACMTKGFM